MCPELPWPPPALSVPKYKMYFKVQEASKVSWSYYRWHQMVGDGSSVWGKKRRSHELQDVAKRSSSIYFHPWLLVHVWTLGNALSLSNYRKQTLSVLGHHKIWEA